ncbi:MAG: right-handed parallel beta-helix repeat-containing protein [Candidatus Omnitrophica bacterium]|nr:right-handed parallel beta-helix repeat-containing protein [Candidatus Omnitrophota bacterium]
MRAKFVGILLVCLLCVCFSGVRASSFGPSVADYGSIQEALDKNPGLMVYVTAGDHEIDTAIQIRKDGSGLFGPGRIVQKNKDQHIIDIDGVKDVRLSDLTLTRAEGSQDTELAGINVERSEGVEIRGLRIIENRSPRGCIVVANCKEMRIDECTIRNYKTMTIDDRTNNPELSGYAFRSVDGTGIKVHHSQGIEIVGNRIIEDRYLPTKEVRDEYKLGDLTIKPEKPGRLMPQDVFDTGYTNNWHQGAAVQVSGPEDTDRILIRGNYYENAAQGMDIHADHVIIANNMVYHAMIGMKAMHGAKNVLIDGNQFVAADLWGLLLMPGSASHSDQPEAENESSKAPNIDGGTIVSNNLFSDFGYGGQNWNWADRQPEYPEQNVIAILFGQLEENPPLRTVLITGNLVYNSGAESEEDDIETRYNYALYLEEERQPAPVNIKVVNNHFEPGKKGVSNVDLE